LNLRPSGYEPDELPGCSTPRYEACASSLSLTVWPRLECLIIISHRVCHVNTFLKNVFEDRFLAFVTKLPSAVFHWHFKEIITLA